ncbi:MAG: exodeoxyribonuclease VII large subunit [Clostridia bacterium]|nr:exodeoxyribonuclease VII large subunit [Clostridia bacterium]
MTVTIDKQTVFTVSQVNECVKYLIEDSPLLDSLYVSGEISNLTAYHSSGHLYFSLKDANGVLKAVMFKSSAQRLKFKPENGMKVLVHGRISVYVQSGQYQLYADAMEPDGLGALTAAYEQLKEKLRLEGLFDESRKKPVPKYPACVGVITSPTGAAVRDIINILGRRSPGTKMILFPALVQGENAAKQLTSGIRYFNRYKTVDVIIIGRGGGSLEELWAFNDETLAREIAKSELPVISAVGHETDFTICDFVSDCRAPTPSAAAELAVPDDTELRARIHALASALQTAEQGNLKAARQTLNALASKRVMKSPDSFLQNRRMELDTLILRTEHAASKKITAARQQLSVKEQRLQTLTERRTADAKASLQTAAARLESLNPLSVLTRGYSAVYGTEGETVRSVEQLKTGETIRLRLSDGSADARVTDIHPDERN